MNSHARASVRLMVLLLAGFAWFLAGPSHAQDAPNLALNQPVESSGANWGSFKPAALTDGDPNTFTHPAADSGTLGFHYEVDLGAERRLDRIVLRNRSDGCCPERLSRVRVEVWSDPPGSGRRLEWSAGLRSDGSNSGVGGVDTLGAELDPDGVFAGRYVRVVNESGAAYNPQLAEIEVYGGSLPVIRAFAAAEDTLRSGEITSLRWQVEGATAVSISPGLGPVQATGGLVVVQPTATTTYTLVAANANGSVEAAVTVGVDVPLAPPDLTEFVADNVSTLRDVDGDASDWIELRNPNRFALSLKGYALTDDPLHAALWVLPDAKIPPHGFLVVFASGKNRGDPAGELHAPFRLRAAGGYLALLDRDGRTVLRRYPEAGAGAALYPGQVRDTGYGPGLDGKIGYLKPATPGATNGPTFAGIVADTRFSRDRGLYDTNLLVEITCATPGAVIRYTTDRSAPTPTRGQVYSGPIAITNTTVLRAAAFRDGWAPTDVDTQTYVFPSNVVASSVMRRSITTNALYRGQMTQALRDLPSFSLVTASAVNDTTEVAASLEWMPTAAESAVAGGEARQVGCGVQQFGGAFTDFAKESFRLYFREKYGAGRFRAPLFRGFDRGWTAVDEFDQLELRNCSHDMAARGFYLSNLFTDDTQLEMGQLGPHGRWVHLYLNGTYWGVYHLRERWGAAMHRSYLGGPEDGYESINGNWNVGGWAEPGTPYDGNGSTWSRLKSLRRDYPAARQWLDVPQFIDYMILWLFGGAEDEYRCVGPTVPGSGFKFYLNDADGWLCIPQYCASGNRTGRGSPGRQSGDGPGSLFSMLFAGADPDYRILLADRIHKALFHDGALTPLRNAERLNRRCAEVERAFLAESARWGYLTPAEWTSRRNSVLGSWFPGRTSQVLADFRGAGFYPNLAAPSLVRQGGTVSPGFPVRFTGPSTGTIWYTLDGTDPRLPGGGVSPSAMSHQVGAGAGGAEAVVSTGSRWRWFADAAGLGSSDVVAGAAGWSMANWKHPGFDDARWSEGPSPLGYGEGDEATVIPFGTASAKWITSYFRHAFVATNLAAVQSMTLRLKCDDGAIVYLNGVEVLRSSMPIGSVDASTVAGNATDDGQSFTSFPLPAGVIREGTNVFAVELHQSSPTTSDASFDLELVLERPLTPGPAAFEVRDNLWVRARARSGTQWSALNEAFFQAAAQPVAAGDLEIRELHLEPPGAEASEFVELQNVSARAVNLRGARFTEGVRFNFPADRDVPLAPGQRLVLVGDLYRFRQRHGIDVPVMGIFAGGLNAQGESLVLVNATNAPLLTLKYGGSPEWPVAQDGRGFSLVLARPELGRNDPSSWRASAVRNGSPGSEEGRVFSGDPLADADADGLVALVEHALGTSDADPLQGRDALRGGVDPEGWFVTTLSRRPGADDVLLDVEESADLRSWTPVRRRSSILGAEGWVNETWGVPLAGRGQVFLRCRVVRR